MSVIQVSGYINFKDRNDLDAAIKPFFDHKVLELGDDNSLYWIDKSSGTKNRTLAVSEVNQYGEKVFKLDFFNLKYESSDALFNIFVDLIKKSRNSVCFAYQTTGLACLSFFNKYSEISQPYEFVRLAKIKDEKDIEVFNLSQTEWEKKYGEGYLSRLNVVKIMAIREAFKCLREGHLDDVPDVTERTTVHFSECQGDQINELYCLEIQHEKGLSKEMVVDKLKKAVKEWASGSMEARLKMNSSTESQSKNNSIFDRDNLCIGQIISDFSTEMSLIESLEIEGLSVVRNQKVDLGINLPASTNLYA